MSEKTPGPYYFDFGGGFTGGDVITGPAFRCVYMREAKLDVEAVAELCNRAHAFASRPTWECGARKSNTDPPTDCDWPVCGCDPAASKVIEALQESGLLRVKA